MRKVAAYCGTRNIYMDMLPSVKSLIMHSDIDAVYLIGEDDEFPVELPECCHVINVSNQTFFKPDGANMKSQYTYMAMMRAALCHVLPDEDVVLSLDFDTIVVKDIDPIWELPIDDCYFSACPEYHKSRNGLTYTNTGVTLYNLKKLRDGKADEVIGVLNTTYFRWVEQDVMNYLCQGRIYPMPNCYNANEWTVHPPETKPCSHPVLIHYAGIKHWQDEPLVQGYKSKSWEEVCDGVDKKPKDYCSDFQSRYDNG